MASEEQYLDDLLKNMMVSDSDTSEEMQHESEEMEASTAENQEAAKEEQEDWKMNLDQLFQSVANEEMNENEGEHADIEEESGSDLAELQAMLDMAEQSEQQDRSNEEMQALLQGVQESEKSKEKKHKEKKHKKFWKRKKKEQPENGDGAVEQIETDQEEKQEKKKEKRKEKKAKKSFFRKKDPSDEVSETDDNAKDEFSAFEDLHIPESIFNEDEPDTVERDLGESQEETSDGAVSPEGKKPGIWRRLINYLLEEDEDLTEGSDQEKAENATGENAKILEELDAKKKKKKVSKDKKDQKNKKDKKDKKDKKKKEKKKPSPKSAKKTADKPAKLSFKDEPRLLSPHMSWAMIALGATLMTAILFLCTVLPEYADRLIAKDAYERGDYRTVYEELNNKKLGADNTLLYERSEKILSLQRKLDSYESRMMRGKNIEALDALFQGIELYDRLLEEDYGVKEQLDGIYQSICEILETSYGISPEEARIIDGYDHEMYTRKLDSLVNGTTFSMEGTEGEETTAYLTPQDVLPAEEEIIDMGDME